MRQQDPLWAGIDVRKFGSPWAKRWTKTMLPEEVAFTEQEAALMYAPVFDGDKVTAPSIYAKDFVVNRYLRYRVHISPQRYWLKSRRIMAIRSFVRVEQLKYNHVFVLPQSPMSIETLFETKITWFLERYQSMGDYRWRHMSQDAGADLLERFRTFEALKF